MNNDDQSNIRASQRAARIGSAAAVTMVGGTIFVDGAPVQAATFDVTTLNAAGAGSLFQAVQDANAAAGPDTITFSPALAGELNIGATELRISDDLTIVGPGSDVLTITNMGVGQNNIIYLYNDASLTVSGVTLDDAADAAIASSSVVPVLPATRNAGNISLNDVVIDDAFGSGIDVRRVGEISVVDSVITRSGESGIAGYYVEDAALTNSTFSHNVEYGVYLGEVDGSVTVSDSTFLGSGDEGLSLEGVTGDVAITGSTITASADDSASIETVGGNVAVSDSIIARSGDSGLHVATVGGDVSLQGVTFTDTSEYAIEIDEVDGTLTVQDVAVSNTYGTALEISDVGGAVVIERFSSADSGDHGVEIERAGSTITMRDIDVDTALDDDAIRIDDGVGGLETGDILIERVTVDQAYGGIEIDLDLNVLVASTVTMRDISVTNVFQGESVYVRDAGDTTIDNLSVADSDGAEIEDARGNVTVTNATFNRIVDSDALEISDAPGDVNVANSTFDDVFDGNTLDIVNTGGDVTLADLDLLQVYDGIDIRNSDGAVTIERVMIETSFNYGIDIDHTPASIGDVTVSDVTIGQTFDGDALEISAYDDVVVERFEVSSGAGEHGIDLNRATSVVIDDVSITGVRDGGIDISTVSGTVDVSEASIVDVDGEGLVLNNVDGVSTIDSVVVYDVNDEGIVVSSQDGELTITDVHVAQTEFEGIEIDNATVAPITLERVTVEGADGGGIDASNVSDLRIVNSTLSGNRDSDAAGAGGLELTGSTASLRHSTVSDNDGDSDIDDDPFTDDPGMAVRLEAGSTLVVDHSIVAANNSVGSFGDDASAVSLTVTNSIVDVGTGLGGSTIEADPQLGELQDNGGTTPTMKPVAGSPAIDSGDAGISGAPATDQRGADRVTGVIDIGSVENDGGGVVAVGTPTVTIAEDGGSAEITLTRTGGSDGVATVDVATIAGTATAGSDFTAAATTATFADNETSTTVSVPIIDDGDNEPDETLTVTISNATGATLGTPASATVTITDNDAVTEAITSLAPQRFADTRPSGETFDNIGEKTGKLAAGGELTVQIAGRGGVPADAVGVVMNVTAVNAEGGGFLTVHGCVTPRPTASSLNYTAGVNLGNEVIAGLSADGDVCLYTSAAANLTVDVVGYIMAGSPLTIVTPSRILDTRANGTTGDGQAVGGGTTTPGGEVTLQVAGREGIPADAAAVVVNVTAIRPSGGGFVTAHPCVDPRPNASSLNHVAGVNRANELVVSLNAAGELCLYTSAAIDLAVDVVAYVPAGSSLNTVTPARILDSRPNQATVDGQSNGVGKFDAGSEYTLQVTGRAAVPAGATAAIVNVTAVAAEGGGFVTVHPCVDPRPLASSLNYVAGVNGGNEIVASLNADGEMCLFTSARAHLTVDVVGYLT